MQTIHWTEAKHGQMHGYATTAPSLAKRWVTVIEHVSGAACLLKVNAGFHPSNSDHANVAEAKAAGERWINDQN